MEQDSRIFLLLKVFVYTMGLVLIGGFIYIGATVYEGLHKDDKVIVENGSSVNQCDGGKLDINIGADIESVEIDNGIVSILSKAKGNLPQKVIIVDYCNNKIISEIVVK